MKLALMGILIATALAVGCSTEPEPITSDTLKSVPTAQPTASLENQQGIVQRALERIDELEAAQEQLEVAQDRVDRVLEDVEAYGARDLLDEALAGREQSDR